jgi:hypothetical protein
MHSRLSRLWQKSDTGGPARDLVAALAIKGLLLAGLYAFFFGPAHRVPSDAIATAKALVGESRMKEKP